MEDRHASTDPSEPATDAATPSEVPPQDNPTPPAAAEHIPEERVNSTPSTRPLTLEEILPASGASTHLPTSRPSTSLPRRTLTRRQVLTGAGILIGVAAIGTGTTLAIISSSSSTDSSSPASSTGPSATRTVGTSSPPPAQTPVPEEKLQAWRTKQLTVHPSQRFKHHSGTALVPLGVVEPTYPNPYSPYEIHLQGYVLGGVIVAKKQFFLHLGLESLDSSQFVAKSRVWLVDQTSKMFGQLVVQQSTDDIEGGPAKFPQVTLAPRAIYQSLPALVDHCIEVSFIRQPLPANQDEIPAGMLLEVNKQAAISDQFLRADYETIHRTSLEHPPANSIRFAIS